MDIKAIKNKKYFKKSDEIYKNIMISSARARQIVDSRYQELVVEEDLVNLSLYASIISALS